jgi:hypothetical protein
MPMVPATFRLRNLRAGGIRGQSTFRRKLICVANVFEYQEQITGRERAEETRFRHSSDRMSGEKRPGRSLGGAANTPLVDLPRAQARRCNGPWSRGSSAPLTRDRNIRRPCGRSETQISSCRPR